MLSNVKIAFVNGQLGATAPSDDGVVGCIVSGTAVTDKFALGTAYLITKLSELAALGITSDEADVNLHIYKGVKLFYDEAPEGSKLWLYGVATSVTMAQMFDKTLAHAPALINAANGTIKLLGCIKAYAGGYTATVVDGLDTDVYSAMTNAQALGVWATDNKYAPLATVLPGNYYSGTASALRQLTESTNNRVAIVIGTATSGSTTQDSMLLLGRYAKIAVQRSASRVKDGPIASEFMFIGSSKPENAQADVINDKGFICPRNFVGKAQYYWNADSLATAVTDDYALMPRRRVIDKAYRIAYITAVNELNDDYPVTDDGFMDPASIKVIENTIRMALINNMTANGNLGVDPNNTSDRGVKVYINPSQNIVSSSTLNIAIGVKPRGYSKYINIELGFTLTTSA